MTTPPITAPPKPAAPAARDLWIARVRVAALEFLATGHLCTVDDLHQVGEPPHPKAWGTVFSDKVLAPVSEFKGYARTRRKEAHGRIINLWGLRTGRETEAKQRLAAARVHLEHLEILAGDGDRLPMPELPAAGNPAPVAPTDQSTNN